MAITPRDFNRLHPVVCVDFDGTIKPWSDRMFDFPEPLPFAAQAVRDLKEAGFRIVIFTSRLSQSWLEKMSGGHPGEAYLEHRWHIVSYLEKYDIPFDDITAEKVPAAAYFDDRAYGVDDEHPLLMRAHEFLAQA